jgi:hypothetical protein
MILLLTLLGFTVNEDKCSGPDSVQIFLGVGMDSDTSGIGEVTRFFTESRLSEIRSFTRILINSSGPVRVSTSMSLLGKWIFIAQVLQGVAMYLRSGFGNIQGKDKSSFVRISQAFRQDLSFLLKLIAGPSPRATVLRKPLTSGFAAWDASTEWGMGGYLDGAYFSVSWAALAAGQHGAVSAFYPFGTVASSHINYLELFAAYWFLLTWGPRLRGHCMVCMSDSSATVGMLTSLWGKADFIPLLKKILRLLVHYDVSLDVHWLMGKRNLLADLLSRGMMAQFHMAAAQYRAGLGAVHDQEDWQLAPHVFAELDFLFGPFQVDACVDEFRRNAHCAMSWTAIQDCMLQRWHGLTVFCNGPFSMLLPILQHFLLCKSEEPVGTAAMFILPLWVGEPFLGLVYARSDVFRIVQRFPSGSALFSAPVPTHLGGGRRYAGPTRWPVIAVWAGPRAPQRLQL